MSRHEQSGAHAEDTDAQSAILAALREELLGFEPQEHDVDLVGGLRSDGTHRLRADWVGPDRSGRIVVATLKETGDEEAILWAVDAVACASRMDTGEGSPRTRGQAATGTPPPLVVLIVHACSARLLATLAFLPADSFSLFEVRPRRGKGRGLSLVRHDLRGAREVTHSSAQGIEAWPPAARQLAESLAARMRRIDPAIDRAESSQGLQFFFRDEEGARLSLQGGKLAGACGNSDQLAAIDGESEAEAWLEQALRQHAARLRSGKRLTRPADLLSRAGPLLTPEELAAFRDD